METICIIDTETTGLDHTNGQVLEIAAILYHIPTRSIIAQTSTLLRAEENPAFDTNRIHVDTLKKVAHVTESMSVVTILSYIKIADAILAHNAEFDKKWLMTLADFQEAVQNKEWICTKNDVIWPVRKGTALNLIHICADLEVPIISAHRALSDCQLLVNAISKMDDIDAFLKSGKGRVRYHADVSYDERQLAKDEGFQWDGLKKVWFAMLTPEIASKMPFKVYSAQIPVQ